MEEVVRDVQELKLLGGWDSYSERFKPTKRINHAALATHHIMEEDLAGCRLSAEFALPADVGYLIGHNVDFDWGVVDKPNIKRIELTKF